MKALTSVVAARALRNVGARRNSLLAGTAMATFVAAGSMFSPLSVGQAQAGCFDVLPGLVACTDFSTNGETVTSSDELTVIVGWDGGVANHTSFEIADGFLVEQEGVDEPVTVAILGADPNEGIIEIAGELIDFSVPDGALEDLIPVTISNDGIRDTPDNEGSDRHALEVTAQGGPVRVLALGDVNFVTTGPRGQDGNHVDTGGGPAFVISEANYNVVRDGINVTTDGGNAYVVSLGDINAGRNGILINGGDTGTTITYAGGDINAGRSAIDVEGNQNIVIVGPDATVSGLGDNNQTAVVKLNSRNGTGDSFNALFNLGTIESNIEEDEATRSSQVAVHVAAGDTDHVSVIVNGGTILGRFDGARGPDIFFNAGAWGFTGDSDFGLSDSDMLFNVYGEIFDGIEGNGVIQNAFDGDEAETAQYLRLENFNNAGVVSLWDQFGGGGFVRDRAFTSGNFIGVEGSETGLGSVIAIDADLGGGSIDADRFIIGGGVAGTTQVFVNNISPSNFRFHDVGIPVIAVVGEVADGTTFELAGGPIDGGFVSYDLYYTTDLGDFYEDNLDDNLSLATDGLDLADNITSAWVLATTLDAEAYQLPVAMYGAQNLWHATAGIWGDRTNDLRAAFSGGFGGGGADIVVDPVTPGVPAATSGFWGRAFGGTLERDFDNSFDVPGGSATFEDSFRQNYYGVIGGLDVANELGPNSAWLWGLLGGLTGSDLDFDLSDGKATYEQVSLGAYATYLNNGFFANALFKADFGNMDYSADGDSDSSGYTSVGISGDIGYRFNFGTGWFVEPKATLAYVNTSFDDLDMLGAGVAFDDGESLRGRLGARIGTTIDKGGKLITPYVEASVWNEFDGDYSAAFYDIGGTPSVGYDAGGTFGEVVAGADFLNVGSGWSAFGKGAVQFGEDSLLGFSGNVGLRKSW